MRVQVTEHAINLWLSANDTYLWAFRHGSSWPCSSLSEKRLFAQFDGKNGDLLDFTVNGKDGIDIDVAEFNAITSDHLAKKLPEDHPAFFGCVQQYQQ